MQSSGSSDVAKESTPEVVGSRVSIRLPGFLIERPVGLGDAIRRTTYRLGISPCSGCDRRAGALNRWVTFYGKR
jgi:hypothetical protein